MLARPLIPADQIRPLLRRLLIVWGVAWVIAMLTWAGTHRGQLDVSLVYSYAISTFIWILTDLPRYPLRPWLKSQSPSYWPAPWPATVMLLTGIPLGYVLGTWVGDSYAGLSTWALLDLDRERFLGLLILSLTVSAAFVAYFYQRGKAETLEREVQEAQLRLLQSQLEPHMLFNTLAHVRALVPSQPAQAVAMIDHLDDFLRSTLQSSRQPMHTLRLEMARLQDYLSLMALRMGERLQFSLDWPEALAQQPVPTFLLQPLVENAIRHGLETSVSGGRIDVRTRQNHDQLCIEIQDSGVGHPDPSQPLGYGLQHVRQRLHSLWGDRARLSLSQPPGGGTLVTLNWPLAEETVQ